MKKFLLFSFGLLTLFPSAFAMENNKLVIPGTKRWLSALGLASTGIIAGNYLSWKSGYYTAKDEYKEALVHYFKIQTNLEGMSIDFAALCSDSAEELRDAALGVALITRRSMCDEFPQNDSCNYSLSACRDNIYKKAIERKTEMICKAELYAYIDGNKQQNLLDRYHECKTNAEKVFTKI